MLQAGRVQLGRHAAAAGRHDRAGTDVSLPIPVASGPSPALLPRYRAVAYGSFVSGLCSPHGDLDLAVELDDAWPHRPFDPSVAASGTLKHLRREDKAELLTRFVKELGRVGVIAGGDVGLVLGLRRGGLRTA